MNEHLVEQVKVGGTTYVVQAVDAQSQYKIYQKLARYGIGHVVAGMARAEGKPEAVKRAYLAAIVAIVQNMPEEDQDYCIRTALQKTCIEGQSDPITISNFCGRVAEYILLGARAIGVQLGDFTCFLSLIGRSTAEAQEGDE